MVIGNFGSYDIKKTLRAGLLCGGVLERRVNNEREKNPLQNLS